MKKKIWLCFIILLTSTTFSYPQVSFKDAIKKLSPRGIESGKEMVTLWYNMSANLRYDRKTEKFFEFMSNAIQRFDFEQIYESNFFSGRRNGYHTVTFEGIHAPTAYHLKLTKKPYDRIPLRNLGDAAMEYALKKNEPEDKPRTYSFSFRLRSFMKNFTNENGARYLDGLLQILDPNNLQKLTPPKSRIYPQLKGESRKLADELHKSFPKFSKKLNRYTNLTSLLTIKKYNNRPYTAFRLVGKLREKNITKDYEEIGDYIDNIRDLFWVKIYLKDAHGHRLSTIDLNSFKEYFIWTFYTANGKVIPSDKKGNPIFQEAFSMSGVKRYEFYAIMDAYMNLKGLKIRMGQSVSYGVWTKTPTEGQFRFKLLSVKKNKVSGAFYHVIPTWLIDIAIPGNIEGLMNQFSQTMVKAHGGKGTRFSLGWNHRIRNKTILTANMGTEFLDNRFVRFGLKIWAKKFRPDNEAQDQIRQLFGQLMKALLDDLKAMK